MWYSVRIEFRDENDGGGRRRTTKTTREGWWGYHQGPHDPGQHRGVRGKQDGGVRGLRKASSAAHTSDQEVPLGAQAVRLARRSDCLKISRPDGFPYTLSCLRGADTLSLSSRSC